MNDKDTSAKAQIGFAANRETIEQVNQLLISDEFFVEQYKKGNTPDMSKFLRVASCLFVKLLKAKNQKALSIASSLFDDSCNIDLLKDCIVDAMSLEVKAST